ARPPGRGQRSGSRFRIQRARTGHHVVRPLGLHFSVAIHVSPTKGQDLMKRHLWFVMIASALLAIGATNDRATAQYGAQVVSDTPGSTAARGLHNLSAAIGPPTRLIGNGAFEGAVTPFNSPFKS